MLSYLRIPHSSRRKKVISVPWEVRFSLSVYVSRTQEGANPYIFWASHLTFLYPTTCGKVPCVLPLCFSPRCSRTSREPRSARARPDSPQATAGDWIWRWGLWSHLKETDCLPVGWLVGWWSFFCKPSWLYFFQVSLTSRTLVHFSNLAGIAEFC